MEKIKVNNCEACEPIANFLNELVLKGFIFLDQQIEDPHFHQLYFKLKGDLSKTNTCNTDLLLFKDGFYLCECHWSRIELTNENSQSMQ